MGRGRGGEGREEEGREGKGGEGRGGREGRGEELFTCNLLVRIILGYMAPTSR